MMQFPLSSLDINFLLSSDLKKLDLPNSITIHFRLKNALDKKRVVDALVDLNTRFPQLKLATIFDAELLSWKMTDQSPKEFFSSLVSFRSEKIDSVDEVLSRLIKKATYELPFEIILQDNVFFFRQNHIFGDALFALKLIELLFTQLEHEETHQKIVIAEPLNIPMLKTSPSFSKDLTRKIFNEKDFHVHFAAIDPLDSAKTQNVLTFTLNTDQVNVLEKLRETLSKEERISINTLMNVLFTYLFYKKNKQNKRTYLSIPTHLSAYFETKQMYPYNFVTNIDVYIDTPQNLNELKTVAQRTQQEISDMQKSGQLLTNVIDSIEQFTKNKTSVINDLQKEYLRWFTHIEQTFVISNVGIVDEIVRTTLTYTTDKQIFLSAPCIGAQPVTFFFVRTNNQINVSCTIDESRLERSEVKEVFKELEVEKIEQMIQELSKLK